MLGWMWNIFGMFNLIKLFMWDIPFMSAKFTYYMFKYTFVVMYYVFKISFELFKLCFQGISALARIL